MIPDPSNSDTHEFATLQTGAPQIWPAAARLGLVDIESGRRFRRVEVDAAPKLSELPRDLSVVFVLDASRSLRDADFDGQLELVRAYLRHVPKARFELVVASRFAERVGEAFVPAKDVDALVARARKAGRFERKNGSALELGIEAAVDALAKRRGTRRVIVFSDGLLRTALRLEEATRPFARAKNVTTHLLVAEGSGSWSGFTRNDSHPLAPIATSSGGILAEYRTPKKTETKEMTPDTLGLIRPVRLDHLTIDGITTEPWRPERDALHEGSGFRTLIPAESATTRPVTVRGLLWSKPVAFEVGARESFAKKTAAWVVAAGDWHGLTPAEQLELALLGHAVSPVTSFVATGPGAEPSLGGRIGVGVSGPCGALPPVGVVPARRQPLGFDLESEFRAAAQSCKQAHPPPPDWTLVVAVETTWDEIVDVVVVPKGPSSLRVSGLSKLDTCIIEAIWDYEVPSGAMQNTRWAEQFTFK